MDHFLSTLPWDLSKKTIRELLGLNSDVSISTTKPPRPFGGYNGEKALIRIESQDDVSSQTILKKVPLDQAQREVQAYQVLTSIGAPVVICYGLRILSDDQAVFAVEYLPYAIDWPISAKLHLDWATATAKFARSPIPKDIELPQIQFFSAHDKILNGIEVAIEDPNPELQTTLKSVNHNRVLSIARDSLPDFLSEIDALPQGLTHGECYPMHMGRRTPEDSVLFFDVATTGMRPRFFDVHGLIVDHGEPYEIDDITQVLAQFWKIYNQDISWDSFRWEVRRIEGLIALQNIGIHLNLLHQSRGEAWQNAEEAAQGHIKWIHLSFRKADEVLTEWETQSLARGTLCDMG